jgi:molybdopterin-guanine dinucleotide biosynthesis protein A
MFSREQTMDCGAGILLAGGQSRRMGQDKALLSLPGPARQTFLERLATVLIERCSEVVLVARDAEQAAHYAALVPSSVRIVIDTIPNHGPLMGLYSGLRAISAPQAFVTAVDTPLLQPELVSYLFSQARADIPLIPLVANQPQVLLAVYPRSILPLIEERLRAGRRDPRSLLEMITVSFVQEEQLRTIDLQLHSFFNVNTPEELAELI